MLTRKTVKYISGYLIGGPIFLTLIPWGLYRLSRSFDHLIGIKLIPIAGLRVTVAIILSLFGLLFALWSLVDQNRIGKGGPVELLNVDVSPKTQNLVVTGPYKYTRNPMLFGTCIYYYALAVYLNSMIVFATVTLFMIFMLIFVVKLTEEPRLRKDFGSEFEEYRQRVSMFVPWMQQRPKSLSDRGKS